MGWNEPTDTSGNPIADSYRVYYSTTKPIPTSGVTPTYITVPAGDQAFALFHSPNGTPLYIQVTAQVVGTTPSGPTAVATAVIGPPTPAGFSITGTIGTSAITNPTGNLYIALVDRTGKGGPVAAAWVATPPQLSNNFTINTNSTNAPPGTYSLYAFIDMNSNGKMDSGDVMPSDQQAPTVTITAGPPTFTVPTINLTKSNSAPFLNTSHWQDTSAPPNESYNVILGAQAKTEVLANITVTSGPGTNGLTYPIDLGTNSWGEFKTWLNVNTNRPVVSPIADSYNLAIQYAGAVPSDTPTLPVTAVLDSFATPATPIGYLPAPVPLTPYYSWTAPATPPTPYTYSFWVNAPGFNNNLYNNMPSSTLSASPTGVSYSNETRYDWTIFVQDAAGNQAQKSSWFTYTTGPGITSFSPASALPGTVVTLRGINFSTTPANNTVYFGCGGFAQATTASATQLTVVVPTNACSGPLQVFANSKYSSYSDMPLTILPTITLNGRVTSFVTGSNISGALVTLKAILTTTTTTAGADPVNNYFFNNAPAGTDLTLSITASGYDPTYSGTINTTTNIGRSFPLYAAGTVTLWNGVTGQGVIRGRVVGNNLTGIIGATVTASGGYTVVYANKDLSQTPDPTRSVTSTNGVFYILHVIDNTPVTMTATATGYVFKPATATAHANAVTFSTNRGYPAISVSGTVTNSAKAGLAGVTIAQVGDTATATSTTGGAFTIFNLPGGTGFELTMSLTGYVPVYTGPLTSPSSFALPSPVVLFTPTELSGLGITTPSKGAIIGLAVNNANFTATLSGVQVSASRAGYSPYIVQYYVQSLAGFSPTATATDASGMFLVMNVEDGATVNINASNAPANTISGGANLTTHAPGVSEIVVPCNVPQPSYTNLQTPTNSTITTKQSLTAFGRVTLNGVTTLPGPAAGLTAYLGYGPVGSAPSSPSWTWIPAGYNTWDSLSNRYEYGATLPAPPVGSYDYAFRYSYFGGTYVYGDLWGTANNTLPFPQAGKLTVIPPTVTTTTLVSNSNPSIYGQGVTFTANVTPTTATGTIQFFDGATSLGSSQLTSGSTSLPISDLPSGTHSITAVYSGDASYSGNTSVGVLQTVNDRVKIGSSGNFLTLQAAINAAFDTNVLLLRDTRFAEDLIVNRTLPFTITLKGGLASDFVTPAATATSVLKLRIQKGKVIANRLVVKPD